MLHDRPKCKSSGMLRDVASIATAIGVAIVALQLWYTRRQERVALEDRLTREYREITLKLPAEVFLEIPGEPPPPFHEDLAIYLHYVDLTNQQAFLRSQRRISRRTWDLWRDGIRENLESRPAFREAWTYIRKNAGNGFNEVKAVTDSWDVDPALWDPPPWRVVSRLRRHRPTRRSLSSGDNQHDRPSEPKQVVDSGGK
jgi:hypothetical protein